MAGTNEEVLRALMRAWGEGLQAGADATRRHFSDDCVWEQPGLRTTTGPEEAAQLMLSLGSSVGFDSVEVEFRHVVAAGDLVCTERIDWMVRADGSRMGPYPVVGITEFRDGKISAWREYFDTGHASQPSGG